MSPDVYTPARIVNGCTECGAPVTATNAHNFWRGETLVQRTLVMICENGHRTVAVDAEIDALVKRGRRRKGGTT